VPIVRLKFPVVAEADLDKRERTSTMADEGESMAADDGESMATGDGKSMTTGDGESMEIGDGESMATNERGSEPMDPDPIVPTDGAN
jgi:hypothetical protein